MKHPYRGRFAPTPSGPLHMGSLVAALGSFLDARAAGGEWLLRIEDVDTPRVVRGAIDIIQRQLEGCGLQWDGDVVLQSQRYEAYEAALQRLRQQGLIYRCNCTRAQLQSWARFGPEGPIYPGNCRIGPTNPLDSSAWRLLTSSEAVICVDRVLPETQFDVAAQLGDFVLQRADGVFAYQLAVVVDDARQNISHVVRGADLYLSTPRQMYLQRCLDLPTPLYLHLPLVLNAAGEKLSKQTLAPAITAAHAGSLIWTALEFLGQGPPADLKGAPVKELLNWAIVHWTPAAIPRFGGQID